MLKVNNTKKDRVKLYVVAASSFHYCIALSKKR